MHKRAIFIFLLIHIGFVFVLWFAMPVVSPVIPVTGVAGDSCAVSMADIMASAQGDVYAMDESASDYAAPDTHYLAFYTVEGDSITDPVLEDVPAELEAQQADSALLNEAWEIFTDLIPADDRAMVSQFNVFTDGFENTLAAVDQRKENPSEWILEIDVSDLQDKDAFVFTMIHEYAHLLTLNASQVAPDQDIVNDPSNLELLKEKAASCPNYFTGNGCSYEDSYIHVFYNRFWLDIQEEWAVIDAMQYNAQDSLAYYEALHSFYQKHRDQFVDDYSVTHPAEDIAEAFAYFVFTSKPAGNSIKEQKIAFFYEYPELVELRADILSGACSLK